MKQITVESIYRDLKFRILHREWETGHKLPSYRTLAQEYQCSINTVRKAIKELEKSKLVHCQDRSGVILNAAPDNRSRLIVTMLEPDMQQAVNDYLMDSGFSIIPIYYESDPVKFEHILNSLTTISIDGLLIKPPNHTTQEKEQSKRLIRMFAERNTRIVQVDQYLYDLHLPYVTSDNIGESYKLTKLLIQNGHRRIAFVRSSHVSAIEDRYIGFQRACHDAGITAEEYCDITLNTVLEYIAEPDEIQELENKVRTAIVEQSVTAIFASTNRAAEFIINIIEKMGLSISRDISLVAYDIDELNWQRSYKITGIRQNFYEMGKTAAKILLDLLCQEQTEELPSMGYMCKTDIILGNSVRNIL